MYGEIISYDYHIVFFFEFEAVTVEDIIWKFASFAEYLLQNILWSKKVKLILIFKPKPMLNA